MTLFLPHGQYDTDGSFALSSDKQSKSGRHRRPGIRKDEGMRVIGVLDLMGTQVVRGVAGRRQDYRPVVSRLTASSEPLEVACALREHLGLWELYLAELDAIDDGVPAWNTYTRLRSAGFQLWVDAGVRNAARAVQLADAGVERVVVGLETVAGPSVLAQAVQQLGQRVVFSLDLRQGMPMGNLAGWQRPEPAAIARQAIELGVSRMLVLDVARVGIGEGPGAGPLCRQLAASYPKVEISTGGGIRGRADLERLRDMGVQAVLVASALHDGGLTRDDLAGL
jgi:phosphoribosylformimino-5-aminoimidazole carboxamide ribotide isomerase